MARQRAPLLDRIIQLPGAMTQTGTDRFGHPIIMEGPRRRVWAMRRDPPGRETLEISESSRVNVAIRYYTIRHTNSISAGDVIVDEDGRERTIVNDPAETNWGRDRFLELTAELVD